MTRDAFNLTNEAKTISDSMKRIRNIYNHSTSFSQESLKLIRDAGQEIDSAIDKLRKAAMIT